MLSPLRCQFDMFRTLTRGFVSVVKVNASSLKSVRVKSRDYLAESDGNVILTCRDKNGAEIAPQDLKTLQITSDKDKFHLKCGDLGEISVQIEIPLESSPETEIAVNARNLPNVHIENLQTKSIKVDLHHGSVELRNLKSDFIDVETESGNITSKSMLLGKIIDFEAKNGDITIEKSQGENLKLEAKNISVESCYNANNVISSMQSALLKSFHGNSTIKSSGDSFQLSGFSGTLNAELNTTKIDIQLSELYGKSKLSSSNPAAEINLGLSEGILTETSLDIHSNCEINNLIDDLLFCQKTEKAIDLRRDVPQSESKLKMVVINGKSLNLRKMSWIDTLQLKQTIGS